MRDAWERGGKLLSGAAGESEFANQTSWRSTPGRPRFMSLEPGGVDTIFPGVPAGDGLRTFSVRDPVGNIVQFSGQ